MFSSEESEANYLNCTSNILSADEIVSNISQQYHGVVENNLGK